MSIQNTSKSVLRVGKNYIKGYTDVQKKVRDATSNEPWGPSGEQMNTLAQLSYNQNEFVEMMEIMDKRLNDKGKNWRHVFKTLTLLDYLLHAGSENCVIYFRDNLYVVKTLKEFQYVDEYGKDQGANVRQKAKDITNLLMDEQRLREERRSRASMRNRMNDGEDRERPTNTVNDFEDEEGRRRRAEAERRRRNRREGEDEELKRAIEESKRMAKEEQDKLRREATDEDELQKALALSREEEEKRIKELEKRNENALFDDDFNLIDGPPNQYAQQQDWQQQQQQFMQPQYTSFNPYMQAQQTGYNPFLQQQMALQQQQEAEYQRQMEMQMAAQQYQQMMTQQQMAPLQPQPTAFGSNNPFAFQQQQQQPQQQQQWSMPQQQQQAVPTGDLLGDTTPTPTPAPQPVQQQQPASPPRQQQGPPRVKTSDKYADLDRMLASGEAQDTFGNTGAQVMGHSSNRLASQPTGNNPFFRT